MIHRGISWCYSARIFGGKWSFCYRWYEKLETRAGTIGTVWFLTLRLFCSSEFDPLGVNVIGGNTVWMPRLVSPRKRRLTRSCFRGRSTVGSALWVAVKIIPFIVALQATLSLFASNLEISVSLKVELAALFSNLIRLHVPCTIVTIMAFLVLRKPGSNHERGQSIHRIWKYLRSQFKSYFFP